MDTTAADRRNIPSPPALHAPGSSETPTFLGPPTYTLYDTLKMAPPLAIDEGGDGGRQKNSRKIKRLRDASCMRKRETKQVRLWGGGGARSDYSYTELENYTGSIYFSTTVSS